MHLFNAIKLTLGAAIACATMPLLGNQLFEFQISAPTDDAEEKVVSGGMDLTSSDLEIGTEKPNDTDRLEQVIGLRFTGVTIPTDVPIVDAYIQFTQDESKGAPSLDVDIFGEDADDAATYTSTAFDISSRSKTAASVKWNGGSPWTASGQAGNPQRTPNLTPILEEITSRAGWSSGNSLSFIFTPASGADSGNRTAESFDGSLQDAARLVVVTATRETYTIQTSADDAEESLTFDEMSLGSSDLEIVNDGAGDEQVIGLRFAGANIPAGAQILNAYVQFTTDEDKNLNPFDVSILGELAADSTPFTTATNNITQRSQTSASVNWTGIPEWTTSGMAGSAQQTPDLSLIIQEIVNLSAYERGNALSLIFEGTGTRTAESFDGSEADAARLIVVYQLSPVTETYTVQASEDDAEQSITFNEMSLGSSDLEIVDDGADDQQVVGLRFREVSIPPGARIESARIQFTTDEDDNLNPFDVAIYGQLEANPLPFSASTANDITARPKTLASIAWDDIPFWTQVDIAEPDALTPDLTAIVQEQVNQDDYQLGNPLVFIFEGTGMRTAESYDGSPSGAPELIVTFTGTADEPSTGRYRLSWSDDPATTMNIIWDQLRGDSPVVYYDTMDHGQDVASYANSMVPTRQLDFLEMDTRIAELTGLQPDSEYFFVIEDSETVSERFMFRTSPATPEAFSFLSTGDGKEDDGALAARRISMTLIPKLRPLFVFWTGDFNSGDGLDPDLWKVWLDDWAELTRTEDGRLFPILPGQGNHEDGDFALLNKLFNTPFQTPGLSGVPDEEQVYYSFDIGGDLMHFMMLNTQNWLTNDPNNPVNQTVLDAQTQWLEQNLSDNQGATFKMAGMHRDFRPQTAKKPEGEHTEEWAPLFDTYGVDLAASGDAHVNKMTVPVRYSSTNTSSTAYPSFENFFRDDANGTMYIGEGNFGDISRSNNDDKPWTIGSDSGFNFVQWLHVFPDNTSTGGAPARIDIRNVVTATRDSNGGVVDEVQAVEALEPGEEFVVPGGIQLVDYPPFFSTVISLPFQSPVGNAPAMPGDFEGEALGFNDIALDWNPPSSALRLQLEESVNGGPFQVVSDNLTGSTSNLTVTALTEGTDYDYRLRGFNIFGFGPYSGPLDLNTPEDARLRQTFREGVEGYDASQTIGILSTNLDYRDTRDATGASSQIESTLMRFDNLIGSGADQIDPNWHVVKATLRLFIEDNGDANSSIRFYQITENWDESSTWGDLGGDGITPGNGALSTPEDDPIQDVRGIDSFTVDVTNSVRAWKAGDANLGWLITNTASDDVDFFNYRRASLDQRPLLEVIYIEPFTYDQFRSQAFGGVGPDTDRNEDFDNDADSNFYEYVFATDPTQAGRFGDGEPRFDASEGKLRLTYTRTRSAFVNWGYLGASDLRGSFTELNEGEHFRVFEVRDNGDGSETVTVDILEAGMQFNFFKARASEVSR